MVFLKVEIHFLVFKTLFAMKLINPVHNLLKTGWKRLMIKLWMVTSGAFSGNIIADGCKLLQERFRLSLSVTCQLGWVVLAEYRTSYLSGPISESGGSSQCKISSASMVWICERFPGGPGFTVEQEQVIRFTNRRTHTLWKLTTSFNWQKLYVYMCHNL